MRAVLFALSLLAAMPTTTAHVACQADVSPLGDARSSCIAASGAGRAEAPTAIVGTGEADGEFAVALVGHASGHIAVVGFGCAAGHIRVEPTCGGS